MEWPAARAGAVRQGGSDCDRGATGRGRLHAGAHWHAKDRIVAGGASLHRCAATCKTHADSMPGCPRVPTASAAAPAARRCPRKV